MPQQLKSKDGEPFTIDEADFILRASRSPPDFVTLQRSSFHSRTAEGMIQDWRAYEAPPSLSSLFLTNVQPPGPGDRIQPFHSKDLDAWTLEENRAIEELHFRQKIAHETIQRIWWPSRHLRAAVYRQARKIRVWGTDPEDNRAVCKQCREKNSIVR